MEGLVHIVGGTAATVPVRQFKPSKYQEAIFDFVLNGTGNGFVEAVAGSGKSTTIKKAAELVRTRYRYITFLAFNSHIAKELKEKLPAAVKVSTIHGVGYGLVKKHLGEVNVDQFKYGNIVNGYVQKQLVNELEKEDRDLLMEALLTIIRYVHATLVDPNKREDIDGLIDHFGIEIKPELMKYVYALTPVIIFGGETEARQKRNISFSDQLWLPYKWNLQPFKSDFVFVDEAQDLTAAQLHMVLKCVKPGTGRILAVGDSRQAIYGFTGADAESVKNIVKQTRAKKFPLSICYRCPKSHIRLAKEIVPEIEWADDAPEGVVRTISAGEMEGIIQDGDLVLCRTTAPLIEQCFAFIQAGKAAKVLGREIGKGLVSVLHKITQIKSRDTADAEFEMRFEMSRFLDFVRTFEEAHVQAFRNQPDADSKIAAVLDKTQCLKIVYGTKQPKTVEEFEAILDGLFSADQAAITLGTVHRMKGLEGMRVFILKPDLMPHPNAKADWEKEQEENLRYVAYTRAKQELYFVQ